MPAAITDPYEQLDRTIYNRLVTEMAKRGKTYPVFSNQVSFRDIPSEGAAINFKKSFEAPDYTQPGGQGAFLDVPLVDAQNKVIGYSREDYPEFRILQYQIHFIANQGQLPALRYLEAIMRRALPAKPKNTIQLYDPTGLALTEATTTFFYKGYINRDMPENDRYWRIQIIQFELAMAMETAITVGAIQQIQHTVEINALKLP